MSDVDLFEDRAEEELPQLHKYVESYNEGENSLPDEKSEFQIKLFQFLVLWLLFDLILIKIAWEYYGPTLTARFSKVSTRQNSQDNSQDCSASATDSP